MPTLADKARPTSVKLLVAADSGSGKTGGLASLVNDLDLELFIADFDNGLDPLFTYVKKDRAHKVHYLTFQDRIQAGPQGAFVAQATAYQRFLMALNDWKDGDKSFGSLYTWGPDRVLVVDSLTFLGNAALRAEISLRGKNSFKPRAEKGHADPREVIGDAANDLEAVFAILYDERIKCHIILNSHIRELGTESAPAFFPSAVGRTLPKTLGRYFNVLLGMKKVGTSRMYMTEDAVLTTKCPVKLPITLPISNGLAVVFKAIMSAGTESGKEPGSETVAKEANA